MAFSEDFFKLFAPVTAVEGDGNHHGKPEYDDCCLDPDTERHGEEDGDSNNSANSCGQSGQSEDAFFAGVIDIAVEPDRCFLLRHDLLFLFSWFLVFELVFDIAHVAGCCVGGSPCRNAECATHIR